MNQRKKEKICSLLLAAAIGITGCGTGAEELPESGPDTATGQEAAEGGSSGWEAREETVLFESGKPEGTDLNLTFSLAAGGAAAGLPQEAIEQIDAINGGKPPAEAIGSEILEGYYALVATYTVIGKDKDSGQESAGSGRLTLYIPNLLDGLEEVSFLYYENAENQWKIIPAEKIDTEARTVSAILPGSGTLTVIYRRH